MKRVLLFVFILFATGANAQHNRYQLGDGRKKVIDECLVLVEYDYHYYKDTSKTVPQNDKARLEIGHLYSRSHSALGFAIDSLCEVRYKRGLGAFNEYQILGWSKDMVPNREDVYFNYPNKGDMYVSAFIIQYEYCYCEPIEVMVWEVLPENEDILGYKCNKAKTSFRGRDYIAWFTPEIPITYGPWKFNNLPGLILKVEDTEGYFSWKVAKISKPTGRKIYFEQASNVVKSSKPGYIKIREMTWKDPVQLKASQGMRVSTVTNRATKEVLARKKGEISLPPIPQLEKEYYLKNNGK